MPRNRRFHYRYRAAELAEKAAEWAQDDDLRALANLFGGECLRRRTPRKANVFYKRLVKDSPYTGIAKIADRLRWFPDCPALKEEMNTLKPHGSVAEVKQLMRKAVEELNDAEKRKEEIKRKAKEVWARGGCLGAGSRRRARQAAIVSG